MPDYELRSYILNERPELLTILKNAHKYGYHIDRLNEKFGFDSDSWCVALDNLLPYQLAFEELYDDNKFLFEECDRINNADKQRRKRLRAKINKMFMTGQCYFVTLTFNDDTMSKTDSKDRRTMVTRFLKTVSCEYVGNVDYGKLNEREHFHAVIRADNLEGINYIYSKKYGWICGSCPQFSNWSKNGFYSIKSCGSTETDLRKMASYVTKLTNHAIKETTKRNALIYSR